MWQVADGHEAWGPCVVHNGVYLKPREFLEVVMGRAHYTNEGFASRWIRQGAWYGPLNGYFNRRKPIALPFVR